MLLSLIAAYAKDSAGARVIGLKNQLPWHFPHDLERFREYTLDCAIIMGRKTHESIGRVLPRRDNIILTRQENYRVKGASVFSDLEEALQFASTRNSEAFVIGGQELYEQTLARADRLYLTSFKIPGIEGDTYFPPFQSNQYKLIYIERKDISGDCFRILERIRYTAAQQAGSEATAYSSITGMDQVPAAAAGPGQDEVVDDEDEEVPVIWEGGYVL
jgi:dihydrofolate reductase